MDELKFGNALYNIRFEAKDPFKKFGHKYQFNLKDAIEDCAEYLVHFPTLVTMARDFELNLILEQPFHAFYGEHIKDHTFKRLMRQFNILNHGRSISEEEWEIIGAYKVFAFKKSVE